MRPRVLLLDIDGTLVDNTAQHIAAWSGESASKVGLQYFGALTGAGTEDELRMQRIGTALTAASSVPPPLSEFPACQRQLLHESAAHDSVQLRPSIP